MGEEKKESQLESSRAENVRSERIEKSDVRDSSCQGITSFWVPWRDMAGSALIEEETSKVNGEAQRRDRRREGGRERSTHSSLIRPTTQ